MGTTNQPKMTKAGQKKVGTVLSEFKKGELHSGKGGKVVKSRDQAIAIAMSEAAKKMGRYK
jgi:ribosomal protein L21E